jgi:hypothetical protein
LRFDERPVEREVLISFLGFLQNFIKNNFHIHWKVGERYMKTISVQITDEEKEIFNALCKE